MGKTTVEIDSELLKSAMNLLGTSTIKDTVHAALTEVVRRRDRARAIDDVAEMVESGEVDFGLSEEVFTSSEISVAIATAARHQSEAIERKPPLPPRTPANLTEPLDPDNFHITYESTTLPEGLLSPGRVSDVKIWSVSAITASTSDPEAANFMGHTSKDGGAGSSEH